MRPGELFVLDSSGTVRETITGHGIDGPWDATAVDHGDSVQLFVSNVLNGIVRGQPSTTMRGDVVRLDLSLTGGRPRVTDSTVVADGLPVRTDPAALVIGPTGLAVGPDGSLFIADTVRSRIARVPAATTRSSAVDASAAGRTVAVGAPLNAPLGLTLAPNGDLLTVNGGNNDLVELTRSGHVGAVRNLDTADPPGGALFGLATTEAPDALYYVNDDTNTLDVLR
jgi:sugar lactone lactonase YvrE